MPKLSNISAIISSLFRNPSNVLRVINAEEKHRKRVKKKFNLDAGLPVVSISDLLGIVDEVVQPYSFLDGTSLPMDLVLLKGLSKKIPGCNYLEIGTWRGESVANVASVATACVTINLPDDKMREMGLSEAYIEIHRHYSSGLPNVRHIQADSRAFDFSSLGQKFDLIFIDGDHRYEGVCSDTSRMLPLLKDENSVLVWHDYAFDPERPRMEVLDAILNTVPDDLHKCLYHVSNTLSCILSRKMLVSKVLKQFEKQAKSFKISIVEAR